MTEMAREIREMPDAAARLWTPEATDQIAAAGARLRALDPPALMTVARGSSDHAALCLKYAIEVCTGRPVASLGPSVVSIFGARMRGAGLAALMISQSGQSADLIAMARALAQGGAATIALTNAPDSPLAGAAEVALDVRAGPEHAVAATKSFSNSVFAGLLLLGHWTGDAAFLASVRRVSEALRTRGAGQYEGFAEAVRREKRAIVLGRGFSLGLASEVALKLTETCQLPAIAMSGAEVLHGPRGMIAPGTPVLMLGEAGMAQAREALQAQGAKVLQVPGRAQDPFAWLDTLCDLPALYTMVEGLSRSMGFDPDAPAYLEKATVTV